jgi:hypothetical protein
VNFLHVPMLSPEVKIHFGVSQNKECCKVFLGALNVIMFDFQQFSHVPIFWWSIEFRVFLGA